MSLNSLVFVLFLQVLNNFGFPDTVVQEETLDFCCKALSADVLGEEGFYEVLKFYIFILLHRFNNSRAQVSLLLHLVRHPLRLNFKLFVFLGCLEH